MSRMFHSVRALSSNVKKIMKLQTYRCNARRLYSSINLRNSDCGNFSKTTENRNCYLDVRHCSSSSLQYDLQSIRDSISNIHLSSTTKCISESELADLMAVLPDIIRDLSEYGDLTDFPDVAQWFAKMLEYNVTGGKMKRPLGFLLGYKMFTRPEDRTPENYRKALIMAWSVELLQGSAVIFDDIIDQSETRRGKLCWYKRLDVGLSAVNDACFIFSGTFQLIKKHFSDQPYYSHVVNRFLDTTHKTIVGEAMDILSANKWSLDMFTMGRYINIVKYKSSYNIYHLPIALSMYMANIMKDDVHHQVENIVLEMAHFSQVENDFFDCYADPNVVGKIGNDIESGRCTWLAVMALQRCTKDQRILMEECYGRNDPEKVAKVKELYNQLSLPAFYYKYHEESYRRIVTQIEQMPGGVNHDFFYKMLDVIYHKE